MFSVSPPFPLKKNNSIISWIIGPIYSNYRTNMLKYRQLSAPWCLIPFVLFIHTMPHHASSATVNSVTFVVSSVTASYRARTNEISGFFLPFSCLPKLNHLPRHDSPEVGNVMVIYLSGPWSRLAARFYLFTIVRLVGREWKMRGWCAAVRWSVDETKK